MADLPTVLVAIRHGPRYDKEVCPKAVHNDPAIWPDRALRPYDSPLCDLDVPRAQAEKLRAFGITSVVSSPFRRSLQTAAECCRVLGLSSITVDMGIGEQMPAVFRCIPSGPGQPLISFDVLSAADMQATVGEDISITKILGELPSVKEDLDASASRVTTAIDHWHRFHLKKRTSCLLVGHGFTVEQLGLFVSPPQHIATCDYCGFIVMESQSKRLLFSDGIPIAVPGTEDCATM
jgi:broad specificity phosphatase PhoE